MKLKMLVSWPLEARTKTFEIETEENNEGICTRKVKAKVQPKISETVRQKRAIINLPSNTLLFLMIRTVTARMRRRGLDLTIARFTIRH
ncbi:MAG TPA: hypothetical protein VKQ72_12415, partial [Aggregatilineales bacterium]|nr:hypothetical protein [Aggregatilineales bacterium]